MLIVGFAIQFWAVPKEGFTQNEIAAANVARMEAKMTGSGTSSKSTKQDGSKFLDKLKDTQAKQMQYLTIIAMILGVGSIGYSFIKTNHDS